VIFRGHRVYPLVMMTFSSVKEPEISRIKGRMQKRPNPPSTTYPIVSNMTESIDFFSLTPNPSRE
jgi:hypothetical protein